MILQQELHELGLSLTQIAAIKPICDKYAEFIYAKRKAEEKFKRDLQVPIHIDTSEDSKLNKPKNRKK